ncbi:hypothetical protein D9619_011980 [Psilocybe cf. subviscida]|uniref:F-box domain-containing protein n=1 Tax=Psilocybe cf. subviscida TaxID=2480587 RepID=A0A8H5EVN7_9AGAR|nr:hypothetical protein D9619_011980 [Psilocybe cf. subviscida]
MPPALPIEICCSIIQSVDAVEDLLDLSLCCSAFREEAQRLLFRHPSTPTHRDQMLFILAICTAPERLGPLVHTYTMEYNPGPGADVGQEATFIAFAISAMSNLKQIEHCASTIMPLKIYNNCKASLDSFNYYRDSKASPDISSLVYDVLPNQPSLTHMIIECSGRVKIDSKMMKDAADLCPSLVSLSVSSRAIGKLLLQRKKYLQSLQWMAGTSTPGTCMTVAQYNHLNYLMMTIVMRRLKTSFSQHLSSLVLLELCFASSWADDILIAEIQFIAHIPLLQYLIIYGGNLATIESLENGQQMACPEVALSAFRMRSTLKHIDLGSMRERPTTYRRVFAPPSEGGLVQIRVVSSKEVDAFRIKYSLR